MGVIGQMAKAAGFQFDKYNENHGPDGKFSSGGSPAAQGEAAARRDNLVHRRLAEGATHNQIQSELGMPKDEYKQTYGHLEEEKPVTKDLVSKHLDMISKESDAAYENGDISNEDYEDRLAVIEHLKNK
jgi:hypothetical protein